MPGFPIIDSHVHLYDPEAIRFDWLAGDPLLNKIHGLERYRELTARVAIDGLVFAEVGAADGYHLKEADWVEREIGVSPLLRGIVAGMPLEKGEAIEEDLAAFSLMTHARGVRRLLQTYVDAPGWALRPSFLEGLRLLPRYGLTFDICIYHPQLQEIIELVRACPEVLFVVDHIAKPGIKAGLLQPWKEELAVLAREPNVECKISGVATEADHRHWTDEQLIPYIAHAIECFGFDRVMFGGDWPVSEHAIGYARWVALVDHICAGTSDQDLRRLYRDNAIRFYRL